jgi:hypothetical protein
MTVSSESRPATMTSKEITEKAGGKSKEEAWQLHDRLWRFKIIDRIIDEMSGMGGDTSDDFQKYYAQSFAERQIGLECDEEIIALQEYARISGDKQGKNKVQIVQMVEEKAAVFPGAGGLFPPEQEKIGFWKGLMNKVTGVKQE